MNSTEERIEALITAMTLEEKVSLCSGADRWHTRSVARLGIPALKMTDGPHGTRTETAETPPVTMPSTCFPTASALAASWNTDLAHRVGVALAEETRARGCHILLGPAVNIHRTPLCGRNFEYFSEDPYLTSRLAVAYIKGLQSKGIGASVKHFACNNSDFERHTMSSEVDERALREIYYPAFQAAVEEAGSWTVMSSYNRINGVSSAQNKPMLTDLLKGEWDFSGFVVSDWAGLYNRVDAGNAGCDLEMPYLGEFQQNELLAAVRAGQVSEATVDDKVRRILRVLFRTGLFDEKVPRQVRSTNTPEQRQLAREAACESIVLLKNENQALPLDESKIKSIAVLGPAANLPIIEGGGSSRVNPYYAVTVLDGIKQRASSAIKVSYLPGCAIDDERPAFDPALVTRPDGKGPGFAAEYFDNPDMAGAPVLRRVEQSVGIDERDLPSPELAGRDFAARWTGRFLAPASGRYRFTVSGYGLCRVAIDGRVVVSSSDVGQHAPFSPVRPMAHGAANLAAGTTYRLAIEYFRHDEPECSMRVGCTVPGNDHLQQAADMAATADAAIVVVGLPDRYESEGSDRPDMNLTGEQASLIRRVSAANPRTVVVLINGSPVNMASWARRASAIVEAWYGGQEVGNAVAATLFGDINPSGKLATTFPKRLEDTCGYVNYPGEYDRVHYGEGIFVGYRYCDKLGIDPLFPFGHGLSYTTFEYRNLKLSSRRMSGDDKLRVSLDVANTGSLPGKEVVQLYVRDVECSVARPIKELKAFQKVNLDQGETRSVSFSLSWRDLAFWSAARHAWTVEPGRFEVMLGSSSRDIRCTAGFTVEHAPAPFGAPRLSIDSRVSAIMNDEQGRNVLRRHLGDLRHQAFLRQRRSYTLRHISEYWPFALSPDVAARIGQDLEALG